MSFDEEWAGHKAAADDAARSRLNGVPDETAGGPRQGDLKVSQKDLAAIGDQAFKLYQRLDTDGDHAKEATYAAGQQLRNDFALGGALNHLAEKWNVQVGTLLGACAHISNHLDYTKKAHAGDEHYIATTFSIAALDEAFDERTRRR
ncbi:hypothetical protein [Streptomyces sparsus]